MGVCAPSVIWKSHLVAARAPLQSAHHLTDIHLRILRLTSRLESEGWWESVSHSSIRCSGDDAWSCTKGTQSLESYYALISLIVSVQQLPKSPERHIFVLALYSSTVWFTVWGGGGLTKGCGHGCVLHGRLAVSGGKVWSGEVSALLVVVFDIQAGEFGEADPQCAAAVIDVLSIQRLKQHSINAGQ